MFGISYLELIVIIVVALLFLKPNDMIKILYYLGKTSAKIKKFFSKIDNEIEQIASLDSPDKFVIIPKEEKDTKEKN